MIQQVKLAELPQAVVEQRENLRKAIEEQALPRAIVYIECARLGEGR